MFDTAIQILLCSIPVASLALSIAVFAVALHDPNQQHRIYLLPLFVLSSVLSFISSKFFGPFSQALVNLWSLGVSLNILHIISVLYIEKWPAPQLYPQNSDQIQFRSRKLDWKTVYRLWGNPQLLPAFQAENSTYTGEADKSTPEISRPVFYFLRLIKLPLYYCLFFHIIPSLFSETIYAYFPDDVSPEQQKFLRRLSDFTAREALVRSYHASVWILESLVFLDGPNSVLACFFVFVGLDQPSDWPSLFGSILEATSLRRFWARFWHRLAVRPYTNYGKVLASSLGLKPGSFVFKTVVACVVFLISGAVHGAVSWRMGVPEWHLDIWWFFLNFLGCLLETTFLLILRNTARSMNLKQELKMIEESWFGKLVGYAWVFGFFFWSVPKWKYPGIYQQIIAVRSG